MDRQEQIGRAAEVLYGQVEEQRLAGRAGIELPADFGVVPELREIALSKIVGLEVRPVTDSSSM